VKAERKLKVKLENLEALSKVNNIPEQEKLETMEPNSEKKKNKMKMKITIS
jgi:hypothetical protein